MCAYIHICIYLYICTHIYICIYVIKMYMCAYIHICIHLYIYTHIHTLYIICSKPIYLQNPFVNTPQGSIGFTQQHTWSSVFVKVYTSIYIFPQ